MNVAFSEYGMPSLAYLLALGEASEARFKALPKKEQERILKEKEEEKERERVEWFIHQGKCPYCDGARLIRGKKNKKNNYQRTWTCSKCNKTMGL